ncbi:hypothetical protein IIA79_08300 [bacterium]|nr:hypothetical protein [bacterium]
MNEQHEQPGSDPPPPPPPPAQPPPTHPPLGAGAVAALIILALLLPVIGPLIALIIGAVSYRRAGATPVIVISVVAGFLQFFMLPLIAAIVLPSLLTIKPKVIVLPSLLTIKPKVKEAEVKVNLHSIQLALERYATDSPGNVYPLTIRGGDAIQGEDELSNNGYMPSYPVNPISEDSAKMHNIAFGDPDFEGNFTYIPVESNGLVKGYYLFGYGFGENDGEDVNGDGKPDHVIAVLSSGSSHSSNADVWPELKDLL